MWVRYYGMPMNEKLQPAVNTLKERFNLAVSDFRDEVSLTVPADKIVSVIEALRDEFGFNMLINETAVDYWPQLEPRFHVIYHLYAMAQKVVLGLRVPLVGNAPSLPTLEGVHPAANWHEREIWDMFGIRFEGHSDMRRILMPQDWEGFPQRKDYPLGYEEVEFTFNIDEISLRKPAAKK
jgi:NADH-quinone oxidoreductase subunit C